jgi:hypothetical protein
MMHAMMHAMVRDETIGSYPRANQRPCTQGSPAEPGSALGSLPVRPQGGLRKGR